MNKNNKKQGYENQLRKNYDEIICLQDKLDTVSAALTKMQELLQDCISINSLAYDQAGYVSLWKGQKYSETMDVITLDMQTEYNRYYEDLGHIKNSLVATKSTLESKLEELRYNNGVLYYMIDLCAEDIKNTIEG